MTEQVIKFSKHCLSSQISLNFLKINSSGYCNLGFNRACLMGKPKVIEFLLNHADDALDDMMRMYDGRGMTGFMQACQWNKAEVVELLIGSSIGKSDVYEGFILACKNKREKIIGIILQNDEFRKHILKKEDDKGNVIRMQHGKTEIRQQIECLNQNQELFISFDEWKHPLDIEMKVNSILNEEETEENDHLGEFKRGMSANHHQPSGQARSSVDELASKNLVTNAHEGLILSHICFLETPVK